MEAGGTLLNSLNRDHLLAPAVEQMADARAEMIRRLREEIGGWEVPAVHEEIRQDAVDLAGQRARTLLGRL